MDNKNAEAIHAIAVLISQGYITFQDNGKDVFAYRLTGDGEQVCVHVAEADMILREAAKEREEAIKAKSH